MTTRQPCTVTLARMIVSFDDRATKALSGDRTGQHSIRINGQWRIVFRWIESHAHDVAVVDYH